MLHTDFHTSFAIGLLLITSTAARRSHLVLLVWQIRGVLPCMVCVVMWAALVGWSQYC